MENRLQDGAGAVRDVSILPVERNAIGGAVPVPEAQRASASRNRELLVEGAIPARLGPIAAILWWVAPHESGKSPAMHLGAGHYRRGVGSINEPGWEVAGLESSVNDHVTRRAGGRGGCSCSCRSSRRSRRW